MAIRDEPGGLVRRPAQKNTRRTRMLNPLACIGPQSARAKGGAGWASLLTRLYVLILLVLTSFIMLFLARLQKYMFSFF